MGMTLSSHEQSRAGHNAWARKHVTKAQKFLGHSPLNRKNLASMNRGNGRYDDSPTASYDGSESDTDSCIDVEAMSPRSRNCSFLSLKDSAPDSGCSLSSRSRRGPEFRRHVRKEDQPLYYRCRNAPDALIELNEELVMVVLDFFTPADRHEIAAAALCRRQRERVRNNREIWQSMCTEAPWRIHRGILETATKARQLHRLHGRLLATVDKIESASVYDVAETMEDFANLGCAFIHQACLKRLVDLLHDETNRKLALRVQVVGHVVAALQKYQDVAELQSIALHAVVFLARPIGGAEGMVFSPGMSSMSLDTFLDGGIKAVLRAMATHSRSQDVQAMGCWSLVNLALNRQQKIMLLNLDGIPRVLNAMATHPREEEVQFRALFALINLVIPEGVTGIVSESTNRQVIAGVLKAMENFPGSEKLVRCGCLVLHNISLRECAIPILLAAGVVKPLVRAAKEHADDDVRRSATSTLRRLGLGPAHRYQAHIHQHHYSHTTAVANRTTTPTTPPMVPVL